MAAGFPLELICQLVLGYAAFKALKAAPPPRTRRKANENADVQRCNAPTSHAEVLRRRKIKQILKAWLVYLLATRLERVLDTFCGWWFPFYSTLRALLLVSYCFCYTSFGEVAFARILVPALKPYERTVNWIYGFAIDILDIVYFLLCSVMLAAASPFIATYHRIKLAWKLWSSNSSDADTSIEDNISNTSLTQQSTKTPKIKRTRKVRMSMMATPHVPGHFIASLQNGGNSIQPPIRPRLHPSERSLDDIPAFMEAMDRAQAAFYEEEEASRTQMREAEQPVVMDGKAINAENVSSKRVRRTRSQADTALHRVNEEEAEPSPRKRRKEAAKVNAAHEMPEAPQRPSAKALGKRKAVSQEPEMVDGQGARPSPRKRREVAQEEAATNAKMAIVPVSKLPRRTAAVTRSASQINLSESTAPKVIDHKAQLAREAAAAARKAARQPKEPASRVSTRRKKAA